MKALVYDNGLLVEKEADRPDVGRGEALIRIHYAGICSTDLEILRGYMDFKGIPGHEFVGTVEMPRSLSGRRVTGEINVSCGRCGLCKRGLGKHCRERAVFGISGRNGAFAEYTTLPMSNLHPVPDSVTDEEAAFTELLAAACEIPERVYISRSSKVAVLGDGRLAAMTAQVLRLNTNGLVVLGVDDEKMRVIGSLGIDTVKAADIDGMKGSFDIVVECTGSRNGLPDAVGLVRPHGTIVLKSTFHAPIKWNPSAVAVDEITIIGSRCGPFKTALGLLQKKKVETEPFLTAIYPLKRWKTAFRRARQRNSFKVLLDMQS
jgi:threonine dehydrogenase-like Zn-dependent dehydrogenase